MEDYEYYVGLSKQTSDFEVTTKLIINHTQQNFDSGGDIAEALRALNGIGTEEWRQNVPSSAFEDEIVRDRVLYNARCCFLS